MLYMSYKFFALLFLSYIMIKSRFFTIHIDDVSDGFADQFQGLFIPNKASPSPSETLATSKFSLIFED